jgi:hypothetical protein
MNDVKTDLKSVYTAPTLRLSVEYVRDNHARAFDALLKMSSLPIEVRHKYHLAEDIFAEYVFMEENKKLYMTSLINPYALYVFDDRGAWMPASVDASTWFKSSLS